MTDTQYIIELVEIDRAIGKQLDRLDEIVGGSGDFMGEERDRLGKLILELTGAASRLRDYRKQYIALGAADVSWSPVEEPMEILVDDSLAVSDLVGRLREYADGKMFGETIEIDAKENAQLVPEYGLMTESD